MTNKRTQLNTNLLLNLQYTAHPPTIILKIVGGTQQKPAANDKEPQIIEKTPSENESHEPIPETV